MIETLTLASGDFPSGFPMDDLVPIVAIIGGLFIAFIAIVGGILKNITITKHKEESRREIAAYIAEGSMSPEDGKAILETKVKGSSGCKI